MTLSKLSLPTLGAALLAMGLVLALTAVRGEAQNAEPQPPAAPETERSEDKDDDNREQRSGNPSEVFIPTEDISEDFAVSFPVDI